MSVWKLCDVPLAEGRAGVEEQPHLHLLAPVARCALTHEYDVASQIVMAHSLYVHQPTFCRGSPASQRSWAGGDTRTCDGLQ